MPANARNALLTALAICVILIADVVALAVSIPTEGVQGWIATGGYLPWYAWAVLLRHTSALEVWAALSAVFTVWITWMAWRSHHAGSRAALQPARARGRGEFGTARWATAQEIARTFGLYPGVPDASGVFVGRKRSGVAFVHAGEEHVCIIGSTGSGKSRRVILPSIGVIGSVGVESLVVTDPKGELYAHSAEFLRAQGYEVVRFDLCDPSRGNRWNPLTPVCDGLQRGRHDKATASAREIAATLAEAVGSEKEPFWGRAAEDLMTSLILAVAQGAPPDDTGSTRWPGADEKHMASVAALLRAAGENGSRLDDLIGRYPTDHPAYMAYGTVAQSPAETRGSILAVTSGALSLFSDQAVAWLTGAQDHDLAAVGRRPTAVFLVIPDESSVYYGLATLYISQTLRALAALADASGGRLPVTVNFILDEFGDLPKIRDFDKAVTVARGRGIRLALAVQDLEQLRAKYGDAAGTIKGNLGLWLYLATADTSTAQEIVSRLGQYTLETVDRSASGQRGDSSVTYRAQGRDLLTMDELMRLPVGTMIALKVRQHPMQMTAPDLSEWAGVWPGIQVRGPEPPSGDAGPVPVWVPAARREPAVAEEPADVGWLPSGPAARA